MREMIDNERVILTGMICEIFNESVSDDYTGYILYNVKNGNTFLEDVINDVLTSSAWEDEGYYNEDDIRLAIGRVLMDRLGIEV